MACSGAGDRAALVIGNQRYAMAPLDTPESDARAMSDRLRGAGYQVTQRLNLDQTDFYNAVDSFFTQNSAAKVILFFYAGHGVQVNGKNFLIPIGAKRDDPDILSRMFDLRYLMSKLTDSRSETKIVILDACRDSIFSSSPNAASGLSELISPPGSFVAFSTAPGVTALDGDGDHSPYTQALLESLFRPRVKIEEAFKDVRRKVGVLTRNGQTPWENTSLVQDFYVVPDVMMTKTPRSNGKNNVSSGKAQLATLSLSATENRGEGDQIIERKRCSRILSKISMGIGALSEEESALLSKCRQ